MNKAMLAFGSCALALAAIPSQAAAAPMLDFNGTSGAFSNTNIAGGAFDDSFTIDLSQFGNLSAIITSIAADAMSDVNFTSVTLNGVEFTNFLSGTSELRSLTVPVNGTDATLRVRGVSGGNGAYAGTLAFTAAPVPAPGAVVLFALGAAAVGVRLGRRRRETATA